MPTSVSPAWSPVIATVPSRAAGLALWKRTSSVPLRSDSIGTPRFRTVKLRMLPEITDCTSVAAPVDRLIVYRRETPPVVSVAKPMPSLAVMSKPTSSVVSTPSGPIGVRVPPFGAVLTSS